MALTYKHTRFACNLGTACLALSNNLPPLLFLILRTDFGLTFEQLGRLVMFNFVTQIVVDVIAARYIDRIGYRKPMVLGYACCAIGLGMFAAAPALPIPVYPALVIGIMIAAIGAGLQEVMLSPITNSLPADESKKAANMAMLHSFYCWGWMAVVLLSTVFLSVFGNASWQILTVIWVALPVVNMLMFTKVPFAPTPHHKSLMSIKKLLTTPIFLLALVLMISSGASELTVAQWASLFAEQNLGLPKLVGDLAGPMMFAIMMGIGRTIYGIFGDRIKLVPALIGSAALCVLSYLLISFSSHPVLGLIGCALTGFSISMMWPGTLSLTAAKFPLGGTAMFAILAMSGSAGAAAGPWFAGFIADLSFAGGFVQSVGQTLFGTEEPGLRLGIIAAVFFPILMLVILPLFRDRKK